MVGARSYMLILGDIFLNISLAIMAFFTPSLASFSLNLWPPVVIGNTTDCASPISTMPGSCFRVRRIERLPRRGLAHVPVCAHEHAGEVRDAIRGQFGFFPKSPFYQRMFIAAGFPETKDGVGSDAMIDSVAVWGSESQVADKLGELSAFGAGEIMASPVAVGADREVSQGRTLRLLADLAPDLARG